MLRWAPLLCVLLACRPQETTTPYSPRAIVVVLDGAPGDHPVSLPGTPLPLARNLGVPITVEAHAALLTGRRQPLGTLPPGHTGAWRSTAPTLPELLARARGLDADAQMVAGGNTILLAEALTSRAPHYGAHLGPPFTFQEGSDAAVLAHLRKRMASDDIHFALLNLHGVDIGAHVGEPYAEPLAALEEPLAALWDWIEDTPPYAGNTHLVVLSDHGRHDWGEPDDWWSHGDQCLGCRSIHLSWAGPSLPLDPDEVVSLTDVSAALAAVLGIAQPLNIRPDDTLRAAGGTLLHRGGLWRDGTLLSTPGSLAEAPRSLGDDTCWRELGPEADGMQHWRPRCHVRELPFETTSPFWAPALSDARGHLWLADHTNINEYTGPSHIYLRLVRDGVESRGPSLSYPQGISLWIDAADIRFAAAHSADEVTGRDTRQIGVWSIDWPEDGEPSWSLSETLLPPADAGRVSAPALRGARVAALVWPLVGGITVRVSEGGAWTEIPEATDVLGHIPPAWDDDGGLWWAQQPDPQTTALCRWDDGDVSCTEIATAAVDVLTLEPGGAWINRHDEGWQAAWVPTPSGREH